MGRIILRGNDILSKFIADIRTIIEGKIVFSSIFFFPGMTHGVRHPLFCPESSFFQRDWYPVPAAIPRARIRKGANLL